MDLTTAPPTKLSDLLEVAIRDARELSEEVYTPRFWTWHKPLQAEDDSETDKCMICLAGAVIARTLKCSPNANVEATLAGNEQAGAIPINDRRWLKAIYALDAAREGDWLEAVLQMHGDYPEDAGVFDALGALHEPARPDFTNWKELNEHLDSLKERARQLRQVGM